MTRSEKEYYARGYVKGKAGSLKRERDQWDEGWRAHAEAARNAIESCRAGTELGALRLITMPAERPTKGGSRA